MLNEFNGRTAVITGAASGIGLALVRAAAARGMNVVMADIDMAALSEAAAALNLPPARVLLQRTDVRHEAQIKALADAAWARFGAVHLLCSNAGVALGRTTWEHSTQDWEWVLGVNLWSVIHGASVFLPRMQESGEPAHILNTASAAGLVSSPGAAAYNVSKQGVVALSETLYHELRTIKSPVGVSVLCPAWVPTGIGRSERCRPDDAGAAGAAGPLSSAINQRVGKALASGRLSADEIAEISFEAIAEERFYVIPHRGINGAIEQRMNEILNQSNPTPVSV